MVLLKNVKYKSQKEQCFHKTTIFQTKLTNIYKDIKLHDTNKVKFTVSAMQNEQNHQTCKEA